jgi:hypothetical protein
MLPCQEAIDSPGRELLTMDLLGNAINALVVAAMGLVLAWFAKGQFEAMRVRFEAKFEAVDRRFDSLEARIDRLEDRFDARMDAMRSDLTQVALAVGVQPRATNG